MKRQKTSPSRRLAARWMRAHAADCFRHDGKTYALVDVDDLAELVQLAQTVPGAKVADGIIQDLRARLTAGVDVQADRLELEVVGWGRDLRGSGAA